MSVGNSGENMVSSRGLFILCACMLIVGGIVMSLNKSVLVIAGNILVFGSLAAGSFYMAFRDDRPRDP